MQRVHIPANRFLPDDHQSQGGGSYAYRIFNKPTKRVEISQIIDVTTVIKTKYVQGVVQNLEMTRRINSFDDDYRTSYVRIESQNPQFMEIDQAGQKYQNHQLTLPGRSDTNLAPLDHDSKGTLMKIMYLPAKLLLSGNAPKQFCAEETNRNG
ncbi:hypothetical protein ABG067_000877 [Albugo candida]